MEKQKKQKVKDEIISWVQAIVVAIVIAWFINSFIIINATVPSGSMENTILINDRIIANRLEYKFTDVDRLDIIVFEAPDNPEILFVKRVIGLPNDTVEIINGELFINGEITEEDYLKDGMYGSFGPYEVPDGHYFMLGDNRRNSEDSRYWENTYVDESAIKGKVLLRYFKSPRLY